MDKKRDFRAEYEALLKQYEEDKKREEETIDLSDESEEQEANRRFSGPNADELAKLSESLEERDWRKRIPEDKKKLNNIFFCISAALLLLMIISSFIAKYFFDDKAVFGIAAIFIGAIIFTVTFIKKPDFAIVTSILTIASGIAILTENYLALLFLIPSIFIINAIITTIKRTIIFIRLLRWIKPLKKACTEKVTAVCINANKKSAPVLIKENIDVIPRYVVVTKRRRNKTSIGTEEIYYYFCPIYELDYYGTKYTLCDNYYGITKTEEGESREILINPKNPQEFYDEKRYKSDAKEIFKTTSIVSMIILLAFLISLIVFLVTNYDLLLG